MTFRRGGAGKRRDANEAAIIEALEAMGAQVWQLSGRAAPDLLVWYRQRPYVFEVKTATGRRRPSQVGTPWPIIRSVSDALTVIYSDVIGRDRPSLADGSRGDAAP